MAHSNQYLSNIRILHGYVVAWFAQAGRELANSGTSVRGISIGGD